MRYFLSIIIALLGGFTAGAQEAKPSTAPTSWNDYVASTVRTFRQGDNRVVLSEDVALSNNYIHRQFDADGSKNGYYIIILYMSKFCKAPTAYFNYGENTGGDYKFHGDGDGTYAYQLLKVKTLPGKTGNIYIKYDTPGESRSMRLLVIEY